MHTHTCKNESLFWSVWFNDFTKFGFMLQKIMRQTEVTISNISSTMPADRLGKWNGLALRIKHAHSNHATIVPCSALCLRPHLFDPLCNWAQQSIRHVLAANKLTNQFLVCVLFSLPHSSVSLSLTSIWHSLLFHISMDLFANYQNDSTDSVPNSRLYTKLDTISFVLRLMRLISNRKCRFCDLSFSSWCGMNLYGSF